jgi:hypothetical protein
MSDHNERPEREGNLGRRDVLKAAGITAAAVGASQLAGQSAASAAPAAASEAAGAPLRLEVVDFVDGHYVVEARVANGAGGALRMRDGLKIEVTAGRAEVIEDPYTGDILVKPVRGDAIKARAVVPAQSDAARLAGFSTSAVTASEEELVGSEFDDLPPDEGSTALAGGGNCSTSIPGGGVESIATPMLEHMTAARREAVLGALGSGDRTSRLRVRAAVMGNVIPFSPEHREIRWRHARYYGVEEVLGLLRFTYQANRRSAVTMRSLGGDAFFPARAVNELYCRMELLDLGSVAISKEPMVFPGESITWPVYATPMNLSKPVRFYDEAAPDKVVMDIVENELRLYDYNGVTIKKLGVKVEARGVLKTSFRVTNQTRSPMSGRWMLIGDHTDTSFASTDAELTLGPAGTAEASKEIHVTAPIRRRLLTQRVGFAVMSLSDPVVLGITPVTFKFPNA